MIHISLVMRCGGTTRNTIDFGDAGYAVLDGYYPESGDGEKPVTESFTMMLSGNAATLTANLREIELALEFAGEHPTGPDGVWMLYSPQDGTVDPWQSRLSGGSVILDSRLSLRMKHERLKARVVVKRQPFWEETTASTLDVTNRTGTDAHAHLVNHQDSDATDDLYLEIAATEVGGGLPAPAIIEYKNTVNDAGLVDHIYVGHFAASEPLTPPTASSLVFEGTGQADANCSGGSYDDLSWADAAENQLVTWSFASAAFRQRNYKLIARLRDTVAYTDLWLKAKLLSGSTVLAETRWGLVEASHNLAVIGSLQIPPFPFGSYVDLGNLTLALYEKRAGGSGTMNLDFIAAFPLDGWRKFGAIGGLAYNETMIDDPVNEMLYTAYSTSFKVTQLIDEGEPILLTPGVKNILYFLHDTTTGSSPIARTAEVTVKYHARRRTI